MSENGLNHGSDFIFSDGSESFKPLGSEELNGAHFSDLDVVRTIVGPHQVIPVPGESSR